MKLVKTKDEGIGLYVELPEGPHIIDIANSLGVFAAHGPMYGALINGVLKEKFVRAALVNNWHYLRKPLALLARTALANPADSRLFLHPVAYTLQACGSPLEISALDIVDAADLEINNPVARPFAECAAEPPKPDMTSVGENVRLIDFSRESAARRRRE